MKKGKREKRGYVQWVNTSLTLFFDSMVSVKTACDLLLSLFIEVEATLLFTHPVCNT